MSSLAENIARLAAFRTKPRFHSAPSVLDRLSDLAGFGSNPGALRARFYVPKGLPAAAPLVVVLHGCTQTAAVYDDGSGWSHLADREKFAVLYPEQQRTNNANLCFNWFVPGDIRRNEGEALSIRQMIETFITAHGLDRHRVFVTGLSAGGAMASVMLATYPEIFAGGAIIAGLPFGGATTIPEAFESMRGQDGRSEVKLQGLVRGASLHKGPWPTVSVWQGSADRTVDSSNAEAIIRQWREIHELSKKPTRTEMIEGHQRRVWCDASGRALIEEYVVAGMAHGTPLKTAGHDGLGRAGAFMLEAGISSTRHIARFWGLLDSRDSVTDTEAPIVGGSQETAIATVRGATKPRLVQTKRRKEPGGGTGGGVRTIIEDALRKAGLMR